MPLDEQPERCALTIWAMLGINRDSSAIYRRSVATSVTDMSSTATRLTSRSASLRELGLARSVPASNTWASKQSRFILVVETASLSTSRASPFL